MKLTVLFISIAIMTLSCGTGRQLSNQGTPEYPGSDTLITQSLFNDKSASISEEDIQKILNGKYKLPEQIRVAIVRLESPEKRRYYWNYWNDEDYIKTQQAYLDSFSKKLQQTPKVTRVSAIPDLLISKSPSFTNIREAAVRLQADVVIVYSITSSLYSKYRLFSKQDIKAFATTQLILMDVRTGLIPFSTVVTRDVLSQKNKEELSIPETRNRVEHEAVLLTFSEIGQKITDFLNTH